MNGNTRISLEEYAKQAGAIVMCETCLGNEVRAYDSAAERMAYAMVTNAWKSGEFNGDSRKDIMGEMKAVLDSANNKCPSCGRDW